MTESEWLTGNDPEPMLEFLRGVASRRRLRLFSVACCRSVSHLLTREESRRAVEVAERYAEGRASEEELLSARAALARICVYPDEDLEQQQAIDSYVAEATLNALFRDEDHPPIPTYATTCAIAAARAVGSVLAAAADDDEDASGRAYEAAMLQASFLARDIFGNPFRPIELGPALRTPDVLTLATAIERQHDFGRMPTLGDRLEAAGCTDAGILAHCREPGHHVYGCWVLDLILGKF